jgi:hypothetical protein
MKRSFIYCGGITLKRKKKTIVMQNEQVIKTLKDSDVGVCCTEL